MTAWAPQASDFTTSPEKRIPPSAMSGTPAATVTRAASKIAVTCGIPTPEMIRVVQIEPTPMPTFTPSAPARIRASAPSAVPTFPATTSSPWKVRLRCSTVRSTFREWPCAVSMQTTSTPAFTSAEARSSQSAPTPTAAPTRRRPRSSRQAFGNWLNFSMSLTVMRPSSLPASSTTSSFSIRCSCRMSFASSSVTPGRAVTRSRLVMTSLTGRSR